MGIAIVILLGGLSCLFGLLTGEYFHRKSLGEESGKICKTSRSSIEASKLAGTFLKRRDWVCRLDVCFSSYHRKASGNMGREYLPAIINGWWAYSGTNADICRHIRLCHFLGCEFILRQIGSEEERKGQKGQESIKMNPKLKREGIDFSYPYNKKL